MSKPKVHKVETYRNGQLARHETMCGRELLYEMGPLNSGFWKTRGGTVEIATTWGATTCKACDRAAAP